MLKIALTGNVASGKSTVLKEFSRYFPTIDCDEIVHKLYADKQICAKITKQFGTSDRRELAKVVFSSLIKRKKLESILHPLVFNKIKEKYNSFGKQGKKIAIVDVPLLFETTFASHFPLKILVTCTKEQQLQRLIERGFSKKESLQRISSQMPQKKKIKYVDFIINTSGSIEETKKQVASLAGFFKELISLRS